MTIYPCGCKFSAQVEHTKFKTLGMASMMVFEAGYWWVYVREPNDV